jgi:transcriptional regulator with XRE-family HTH domain
MNDRRLGRVVRTRRHRRGWRLVDLAARARVGPGVCSLLERGYAGRLTVRTARAIAAAVDLPLDWDIGWQRQEIDRLLDADHATLIAAWVRRLEALGWVVRTEVSFNHYGDRGRIDVVAFHPDHRVLLVVEVKTALVDAQDTLGTLDVKARVAPIVARDLGWRPRLVVPAFVIAEGTTARRQVARLEPLFGRYALRGHAAASWLRDPASGTPTGLLVFTKLPSGIGIDRRRAGRRRVRLRGTDSRSGTVPKVARDGFSQA